VGKGGHTINQRSRYRAAETENWIPPLLAGWLAGAVFFVRCVAAAVAATHLLPGCHHRAVIIIIIITIILFRTTAWWGRRLRLNNRIARMHAENCGIAARWQAADSRCTVGAQQVHSRCTAGDRRQVTGSSSCGMFSAMQTPVATVQKHNPGPFVSAPTVEPKGAVSPHPAGPDSACRICHWCSDESTTF